MLVMALLRVKAVPVFGGGLCAICLEDLEPSVGQITKVDTLMCGHVYHSHCYAKCLECLECLECRECRECPLCRKSTARTYIGPLDYFDEEDSLLVGPSYKGSPMFLTCDKPDAIIDPWELVVKDEMRIAVTMRHLRLKLESTRFDGGFTRKDIIMCLVDAWTNEVASPDCVDGWLLHGLYRYPNGEYGVDVEV